MKNQDLIAAFQARSWDSTTIVNEEYLSMTGFLKISNGDCYTVTLMYFPDRLDLFVVNETFNNLSLKQSFDLDEIEAALTLALQHIGGFDAWSQNENGIY